MKNDKKISEFIIQDKGKALKPEAYFRERVVENRTIADIRSFPKKYKLAQAYANVRNLDYKDEKKVEIQSFKDYLGKIKAFKASNFAAKSRPQYPEDERYLNTKTRRHYPKGEVVVLVHNDIYAAVSTNVNQYVLDLGREGYWATIHVYNGGTPAQIRSYLHERRPRGALLVGAIPAAWYEMSNDFHGYADFPCDLFYMDRDGSWSDPDHDAKYSSHGGNVRPEMWVGRLYTPTADGNDAALINDYLSRNHRFRTGDLGHAHSALAYVDDDWQGFDDCAFDAMFPASEITKYTNPTTTDADLYKAEVNSLRSWVQLCAHSSPTSHALRVGSSNEYIQSAYFRDTNPPNAHFYNLFCCGPGRFTTDNYLGGWYIFDKSGGGTCLGLTAVASSKSGSMKYFEDFYEPMNRGRDIGDAYLDWWADRGTGHDLSEQQWFYGLVLLGDPTLNWWKGNVPRLEQPQPDDVFDQYPRKMQLRWTPVTLSNVKYTVEIDAYGAVQGGQWAAESGRSFRVYRDIAGNTLDHSFVGAQRGRWRVRAQVGNQDCSWSEWRYFRFTH